MLILQFQVQIVEKLAYVVKQRKLPVKLGIVVSFTENSRVNSVQQRLQRVAVIGILCKQTQCGKHHFGQYPVP